ncbi:hypothetical protein C922_00763 [Plasmodium inui San Antonio 1]|uniref:Uncharacterized protein n=1 Tax=Plasmodium inui San Antonio 1 TaxID=1237626 RepID=W7AUJ0_9APIC|nr:hypothetical protein C922_00763 [Plasmodium inui San Antonio 1]EUD69071.1 hypothetical protein C922_00763 [Plasmodium inui San Antonio 1]
MKVDAIDFVFSLLLDVEIYLCVFVLLTYFTRHKMNKIIQSNFYQNDALLNRLSKHFYIVDVRAYFSPLKYMFKSALYHTYYSSSLLFLIYLFRLYIYYKRWIKFYFFSLLNIANDSSILSDDDDSDAYHHRKSSGFHVSYMVAFIFGVIISFIYYRYLCRVFKGKHKYVTVAKTSLLHYCFELAKVNFREYVKVKPKKGSKFRFDLDTNIKAHPTFSTESGATKGTGRGNGTSASGRGPGSSVSSTVAPKPKRKNILFRMFSIVYFTNHVLYDEKVLYEDHLKNKRQGDHKKKESFCLMLIKLVGKLVQEIINSINARNNENGKSASRKTGQAATGQAATGQAATGQATTGQATTGQATTGQATTGQATTGQAITGQDTTGVPATGQGGPHTAPVCGETPQEGVKQPVDGEAVTEEKELNGGEAATEEKELNGGEAAKEEKELNGGEAATEEKELNGGEATTEVNQPKNESPKAQAPPICVAPPAQRQSNKTTPQEQTQGITSPTNMTQIKGAELKSSNTQYNDINMCELDLNPYDIFVCNSHYQFKSILEVFMLHVPIYFLFKNKLYVKTCFTIAMYIANYLLWNFITLLAMIRPSLFVYYYVVNEHINHILTENINEKEKNIILHFFYGFFFASLIYLKYHFNMQFKLIKVDHMNHFHRIINKCITEAHKLKSRGIIKNFEAMKVFPLCIDYENKGIFIDRGLLRTRAELELVLKRRKLKSARICFRNVMQVAKYCDEDTAMELFRRLKFVLVNELPHRVALNLSLMISDEMYDKIKRNAIDSSSSEQSKKHPSDCLCEMLKKTVVHDFIKAAMGIDKFNAENEPADSGEPYVDTSDNK